MPVAAVDKNGNARTNKDQVCRPPKIAFGPHVYPVPEASSVHETPYCQFGLRVAPSVTLHDFSGGNARCPRPSHADDPRRFWQEARLAKSVAGWRYGDAYVDRCSPSSRC